MNETPAPSEITWVEITAAAKAQVCQHLENSPVQTHQSTSCWSCLQKWSSSVSVLKCCPDFILAHSSRANVVSMWFTQLKMFWKRLSSFCIWCNAKFHLRRAAVALCGPQKPAERSWKKFQLVREVHSKKNHDDILIFLILTLSFT